MQSNSSARRDFLLSSLLDDERQKTDRLLLNILPGVVADRRCLTRSR